MNISAFGVVHKGVPKLMKAKYLRGEDVPHYIAERMQAHVIGRGVASGDMPTSKIPEARKARYKTRRRVEIDQAHKPKRFTDARRVAENKHNAAKKARKAEKAKIVTPQAPKFDPNKIRIDPPRPQNTPKPPKPKPQPQTQPQSQPQVTTQTKVPVKHTKRNALIGGSVAVGASGAGGTYYYNQKQKEKKRLSIPLSERIRRTYQ